MIAGGIDQGRRKIMPDFLRELIVHKPTLNKAQMKTIISTLFPDGVVNPARTETTTGMSSALLDIISMKRNRMDTEVALRAIQSMFS
jgi:hypothetical protein